MRQPQEVHCLNDFFKRAYTDFLLRAASDDQECFSESRMDFISAIALHRKSGGTCCFCCGHEAFLVLRLFRDLRFTSRLFLLKEPHADHQRRKSPQNIRGNELEGSAVRPAVLSNPSREATRMNLSYPLVGPMNRFPGAPSFALFAKDGKSSPCGEVFRPQTRD
jgi:hypothetical protein